MRHKCCTSINWVYARIRAWTSLAFKDTNLVSLVNTRLFARQCSWPAWQLVYEKTNLYAPKYANPKQSLVSSSYLMSKKLKPLVSCWQFTTTHIYNYRSSPYLLWLWLVSCPTNISHTDVATGYNLGKTRVFMKHNCVHETESVC